MVISAIERQKRHPQRVNIFIDGIFALGIHKNVLGKFGFRNGDTIDERTLKALQNEEDFTSAKDKALRLMSYRLRSQKELRQRLHEKKFSPEIVDQTIHHLESLHLIDDKAFAEAFVHDLILKKSAGKTLLQRELRQKGIANDIISEILSTLTSGDDEQKRALTAASTLLKRYKSSRKATDAKKQQQRITAFLMRRGFDFSTINKVIKNLFSHQANDDFNEP